MSKGFVRTWRCEEDIPGLWENPGMFCAYYKLRTIAARPGWSVTAPWNVLAKRMKTTVNTLRKAVLNLEKAGLLRVEQTPGGITRLVLVYADEEPDLDILMGSKRAAGKEAQTRGEAPGCMSKIDMPGKVEMSKFDKPQMSKIDMPSSLYKQEVKTNKKTTPTTPPTTLFDGGFAAFWDVYPNKKAKDRAVKRWNRGNYQAGVILPILERQIRLREWVKENGRFIPRADAYLNQKRWEDVLPEGEEWYVLDFKSPKTERETTLRHWLEAVNPALLNYDNQKINGAFENDRADFEEIVVRCGGNVQKAFEVMRYGWRCGCNSMRGICERVPAYLDELNRGEK